MQLSRLIRGIALTDHIGQDVEITSLTSDTRSLVPGGLFAALKGTRTDGTQYISQALDRGAAAVLCEKAPDFPGPWLVAKDARQAYGLLCANWFGNPADRLTLLGVTGTNGKTTTTYLLKHVLEEVLRAKVGLVGTNQNLIGDRCVPATHTTPDPYGLHCLLSQMVREGCAYGVMEVSSHALDQGRTAGLRFRTGIFTNLTRDHLDYHGTMEDYRRAKEKLFSQCGTAVLNLDDPAGRAMADRLPNPIRTFGKDRGEVRARDIHLRPDGVAFTALHEGQSVPVRLHIPGLFSVYNALGVLACCLDLGIPLEKTAKALETAPGVKGRAEVVPVPAPYTVLIDYAHTPDALEKILQTARDVTRCRLLCLFGCGGDRDRSKRPIMGAVAADLADQIILTSDNPRTEDPETILDDIARGFPRGFDRYIRVCDRREAIRTALAMGRAGDVILLAGKGHETWQDVGGQRNHFDEREEITSFFEESII
ncbi:MAG: UDP-N-acetylmuramoyl-L-alanyl-D-glutamate--2,6-diaminopimelate ligase [Ruminiclostridium sp.]|nr:UDP-N-acetylmuramoyl-L-alanyl-D-glutamate--2,6-diaminopimelate ligase [Ruminiclostridium sp.]